jgi:hypothetical protein
VNEIPPAFDRFDLSACGVHSPDETIQACLCVREKFCDIAIKMGGCLENITIVDKSKSNQFDIVSRNRQPKHSSVSIFPHHF